MYQNSIRILLAMIFTIFAGSAVAKDNFSSRSLADDLYLVVGPEGNTLVAVDHDGLILIEGVDEKHAKEYLKFVKKLTGEKRIKSLVNTHWHPESAGLNKAVIKSGGDVISHANTKQWLAATIYKRGEPTDHKPVPAKYLPTKTFYDKYSISFRSGSIELGYLLQAHTDGDIYAYLPDQDILFTGPVLRTDSWATVDEKTNGFIGGLMDALDTLSALITPTTKIIPASGEGLSKDQFLAEQEMYKGLTREMAAMLRASKSTDEVIAANPADGLRPEWGSPVEFLDQGFRSYFGHLRNSRHVGVMP